MGSKGGVELAHGALMKTDPYVIERRDGDPDLDVPTAWVILTPAANGCYKRVAFTSDKAWAERIKAALLWQDSMGEFFMSIHQDGIRFDQKSGLPIISKSAPRSRIGMKKPSVTPQKQTKKRRPKE